MLCHCDGVARSKQIPCVIASVRKNAWQATVLVVQGRLIASLALAMTEKSFCFVILKPLAAEESQSIRIQRDCFASPQHDKIPCVIASEQRERGNQQAKNPKRAFKDC